MKNSWLIETSQDLHTGTLKIGRKAHTLIQLEKQGIKIPRFMIIPSDLYLDYGKTRGVLPANATLSISEKLNDFSSQLVELNMPPLFAVRASTLASTHSPTILNVGLSSAVIESLLDFGGYHFTCATFKHFLSTYCVHVLRVDERLLLQKLTEFDLLLNEPEDVDALTKTVTDCWNELGIPDKLINQVDSILSWHYTDLTEPSTDSIVESTIVQAMVFGNASSKSAKGFVYTRHPVESTDQLWGYFSKYGQWNDTFTMGNNPIEIAHLDEVSPHTLSNLTEICHRLEELVKDALEIEFVIQKGELWVLDAYSAKRTVFVGLNMLVEFGERGIYTRSEAIKKFDIRTLPSLVYPIIDVALGARTPILTSGDSISPGVVHGRVIIDPEATKQYASDAILVRPETLPQDFSAISSAKGLLTARGGRTSHAAVISKSLGKICIVGAQHLVVDTEHNYLVVADKIVKQGDWLTLDGNTGKVYIGIVPTKEPEKTSQLETLIKWSDEFRQLKIRANVDTSDDIAVANQVEAEGIGLYRTEHLLITDDRINDLRLILMGNDKERFWAATNLERHHFDDFVYLFRSLNGKPVSIRLLDIPLSEILPKDKKSLEAFSSYANWSERETFRRTQHLYESNSMLGMRGCRLSNIYPEITMFQAKAIFSAAASVIDDSISVNLEIMVPFAISPIELEKQRKTLDDAANSVGFTSARQLRYKFGTMIELPRAALIADELASVVDYFSFGTNDLTQTTLGISRDDSSRFLQTYLNQGFLKTDPFQTIDVIAVGKLIEMAVKKGQGVKKDLVFGVCGEHAGDPSSAKFFHNTGINYLSCSPSRIMTAKIAAAQAAI